jgi:uncharacterized protein (DUF433 family)
MSDLLKRISIDPTICNGQPIIRGHRLSVQTVLDFLFAGNTEEEIVEQYPYLEIDDIRACKEFIS